ncbi:MAG: iron-sulfur cluster assembly protein [Phycisphaerales bacterium]|nr:iron-sulfur cluster assembly protein [Phycisphaerales bacterium]
MSDTSNNQREQIITALKTVRDPELPINIYDLGLVYELDISDGQAHVRMTLTTPNCPMADVILSQAQKAIESVDGISGATVELIWEPVWDPSRISENAKLELEFMGLDHIFETSQHGENVAPKPKISPLTVNKTSPPPHQ